MLNALNVCFIGRGLLGTLGRINCFYFIIVHHNYVFLADRTGLQETESVERLQDSILGAYKRYIAEQRPEQPVHWAKILMKVTDLRTISTRHAERVLCIKLDAPQNLPPLFLEMFSENNHS